MILIGLGGKQYSHDHVIRSADLCSESIPEFLSLLTVSLPSRGKGRVEAGYKHIAEEGESNEQSFQEMDTFELLDEMKRFLEALDIPRGKGQFFAQIMHQTI